MDDGDEFDEDDEDDDLLDLGDFLEDNAEVKEDNDVTDADDDEENDTTNEFDITENEEVTSMFEHFSQLFVLNCFSLALVIKYIFMNNVFKLSDLIQTATKYPVVMIL